MCLVVSKGGCVSLEGVGLDQKFRNVGRGAFACCKKKTIEKGSTKGPTEKKSELDNSGSYLLLRTRTGRPVAINHRQHKRKKRVKGGRGLGERRTVLTGDSPIVRGVRMTGYLEDVKQP